MYESACSAYENALDLKRSTVGASIKTEDCLSPVATAPDWPTTGCAYRFACNSTFQQLKQSVEKAKAALQDRGGYLSSAASAFGELTTAASFCASSRTVNHHPQLDHLLTEELRDDVLHEKRSHGKISVFFFFYYSYQC